MAAKRVLVTFTAEQWKTIESLKGLVGRGDADLVRSIVLNWLMEKGYFARTIADRLKLRKVVEEG